MKEKLLSEKQIDKIAASAAKDLKSDFPDAGSCHASDIADNLIYDSKLLRSIVKLYRLENSRNNQEIRERARYILADTIAVKLGEIND